ncbi:MULTISPECIES: hypothetical protein [Sphingobium]|uniref:Uncharacterized protein n=1 Tax=Sphingobium cupriresistens TaxID=1132417 RepID=A0A8G1ZIS5_9SPHN|nr:MULTISPECIES: hypothetical protein [Sphingobium]MBJ7375805.1 hypothetical protein [Sphingobium sp.]RYM14214.1 hypothetical protein EWH12_03355 [Sphingobium cupriresistens]
MTISRLALAASALAAILSATIPATVQAEGLGAEINYGRADGHWGTEIGAGYALNMAGFSLTPGAGVYLRDGDTKLYGRVEAAYTIPLSATIGAGARFSGDHIRPYATLAMPIIPKLRAKANVGPRYYAVGLTLGY